MSLDNPSPLLSYTPPTQWIPITSQIDQYADQYGNDSTASATSHIGAEVSLTFYGTGVWLYGAKRDTHGYYNVTLDSQTQTFNGYASPNKFQQLLFAAGDLNLTAHTIQLINAGPLGDDLDGVWLDIDWLTWETVFVGRGGPDGAEVANVTFRNNHPRFQYIPSDVWSTKEYTDGEEINGTSSYTTDGDASVQFTFESDAVGLYGSVNGSFSAGVDGSPSTFTSAYNASAYQQLLYYTDDLGAGSHTLTIANTPKSTFAVDFARTWTAQGGSQPGTTTSHVSSRLPIGPIVGGAVGALVFISTLFAAGMFLRKRKSTPSPPGDRTPDRLFGSLFLGRSKYSRKPQPHPNTERSRTASVNSRMSRLSGTSDKPLLPDSHSPQTASEWYPDFIPMTHIRKSNPNVSSETSEDVPSPAPSTGIIPIASTTAPPIRTTDSTP